MDRKPERRQKEVFEELAVRFIINEKMDDGFDGTDFVVVLETIHWFYEDICCGKDPTLPKLSFDKFCESFCQSIRCLNQYSQNIKDYILKWKNIKGMHVAGIICIDKTGEKVLSVRPFYKKKLGFPKGKLEYGETPIAAAAREACEELGIDISQELIRPKQRIELDVNTNHFTYFIIRDVPTDLEFSCDRRNEIAAFEWVPISKITTQNFDELTADFVVKELKKILV